MFTKKGLTGLVCGLLMSAIVLSACSNDGNNGASGSGASNGAGGSPESSAPAAETGASDEASASSSPSEQAAADLKPVELTWYFPNGLQNMKDVGLVQAEMDKITKAKINATVKLMPIDFGAYDQKMNVMAGAGEKYDLVFTAPWMNNYFQNVSKGALLPLDDLLDQYAPQLKALVPQSVWDATRVDGKIYGAINLQIVAMPYGITADKKYIEKYNVNVDAIQKYEDLEPYLAQWKESYPPLAYTKEGDIFSGQPPYFGMDSIGDDAAVGWIRLDDPELTVINQFASPEFKQFVELLHKWYEAGYVPKDAALRTSAQLQADTKAGKTQFFTFGSPIKPGVEAESKAAVGVDIIAKPLSKALITTNRAIATMTGISSTSANPERAMMFLELINTDKDLYNLVANGIEGKHYKKVSDNLIEKVQVNNGYNPNTDWMFGDQFNAYYTSPDAVGNWDKTIELNNTAEASPILGFSFNPDPVKAELAQTSSVYQQYKDGLLSGTNDPAKVLPEFLDKLQKAGADKIIAEKQKQIDAWKAGKP